MISKYVILMREVSYDECPDSDYIFHKRPRDDLKKKAQNRIWVFNMDIYWTMDGIYNNKLLSQRKSDFNAKLIWPGSSEGLRKGF